MTKLMNDLYNRATKKGVAIAKNYVDYYGYKLSSPIEKYRVEVKLYGDSVECVELYHYGTLTLSVNKEGFFGENYQITELYGQSNSDKDSIENILTLFTEKLYSPLKLTYRNINGGFGFLTDDYEPVFLDDFKDKQDFINLANKELQNGLKRIDKLV